MSDNYKPEIVETYNRERALVVRGVPMVGERVETPEGEMVVESISISDEVTIWDEEGMGYLASDCSPAPDEDEELVERVAKALGTLMHSHCIDGFDARDMARAAIRAVKEGGNG